MSTEFTTPAKFLVVTTTSKGVKIHRITCNRRGDNPAPLDLCPAEVVAKATPATCCRPKAAEEHIAFALESLPGDDDAPKAAKAAKKTSKPNPFSGAALLETVAKDSKPEQAATGMLYSRTIFLSESKVAKHYWDVSRPAAVEIAGALGATVEASNKDLSIRVLSSVSNAEAKRVADAIESCWQQGYAEFKEWKKTDADYRAIPMSHDPKSDRCIAERVHLAAFAQIRVAHLRDADGVL